MRCMDNVYIELALQPLRMYKRYHAMNSSPVGFFRQMLLHGSIVDVKVLRNGAKSLRIEEIPCRDQSILPQPFA